MYTLQTSPRLSPSTTATVSTTPQANESFPVMNGKGVGKETSTARSSLVIRNVVVDGRRTSIRLEPEMWASLQEICKRERCSTHDIATMIAIAKGIGSLTAAMRVFIMVYFRTASTEDGHNKAGHGSGSVLQPLFNSMAAQQTPRR